MYQKRRELRTGTKKCTGITLLLLLKKSWPNAVRLHFTSHLLNPKSFFLDEEILVKAYPLGWVDPPYTIHSRGARYCFPPPSFQQKIIPLYEKREKNMCLKLKKILI